MPSNASAPAQTYASDTGKRDPLIDAWRGLSVLLVIQSHAFGVRFAQDLPSSDLASVAGMKRLLLETSSNLGDLGVKFFFVISGYIITALLIQEQRHHGQISINAFYIRRAFRILPSLWLFLGFTFLMSYLGYLAVDTKSFLLSFAFLCNTDFAECAWPVAHLWSLAVEEQFYLTWPALALLFMRTHLTWLAIGLLMIFSAMGQLSLLYAHGWLNNAQCFACLAAGIVYASSPSVRTMIARWGNGWSILFAVATLVARPLIPQYFAGQTRILDLLLPVLIVVVLFGSLRHRLAIESAATTRVLSRVGLISYGLYLWQQLFFASPADYLRPSFLEFAPLCFVFAVGSYIFVESPLIRIGNRLSMTASQTDPVPGRMAP